MDVLIKFWLWVTLGHKLLLSSFYRAIVEAWVGGTKLSGTYHLFSIPRKFKSYGVGDRQRTGAGCPSHDLTAWIFPKAALYSNMERLG